MAQRCSICSRPTAAVCAHFPCGHACHTICLANYNQLSRVTATQGCPACRDAAPPSPPPLDSYAGQIERLAGLQKFALRLDADVATAVPGAGAQAAMRARAMAHWHVMQCIRAVQAHAAAEGVDRATMAHWANLLRAHAEVHGVH